MKAKGICNRGRWGEEAVDTCAQRRCKVALIKTLMRGACKCVTDGHDGRVSDHTTSTRGLSSTARLPPLAPIGRCYGGSWCVEGDGIKEIDGDEGGEDEIERII